MQIRSVADVTMVAQVQHSTVTFDISYIIDNVGTSQIELAVGKMKFTSYMDVLSPCYGPPKL